jgi:hypothetical protein
MSLPTLSTIMDNLHIGPELAECLLTCRNRDARHWMEDRLGLRRDNDPKTSIPKFNSPILKRLMKGTKDVISRLVDEYPSCVALQAAVANPRFVSQYTDELLDQHASQIWGLPTSPNGERLCYTALSWEIEEDRERFV